MEPQALGRALFAVHLAAFHGQHYQLHKLVFERGAMLLVLFLKTQHPAYHITTVRLLKHVSQKT